MLNSFLGKHVINLHSLSLLNTWRTGNWNTSSWKTRACLSCILKRHCCWWLGYVRNQVICSHAFVLVMSEHSNFWKSQAICSNGIVFVILEYSRKCREGEGRQEHIYLPWSILWLVRAQRQYWLSLPWYILVLPRKAHMNINVIDRVKSLYDMPQYYIILPTALPWWKYD